MTTPTKDPLTTITIKAALSFPEGTPIPRICGKLTHIFGYKSGEGDFGHYTSQSGVISDDSGDKILFTIWNKPSIPEDYMGRWLIFRSGAGKKVSMSLKSDFKDSSKRTLNVTKSCHVLTEEEDTDDIPMDYPEKPKTDVKEKLHNAYEEEDKARERPRNSPQANVEPKKAIPENHVQEVKKKIMQMANLRSITDDAASFLYQDQQSGMVEKGIIEKIKDVSSCFFIQGIRDGLHLKLPDNKPIFSTEEREPSEGAKQLDKALEGMFPSDQQF